MTDAKASARSKHFLNQQRRDRLRRRPLKATEDEEALSCQPSLPSNWDRYLEEEGDVAAPASACSAKPAIKSKGADYRELLSQDPLSLSPPSPEFAAVSSAMLFTRGSSLVAWDYTQDDGSYQAPLLSLNLDSLSSMLSKFSLAERLFVDPGHLPIDHCLWSSLQHADTQKILVPDVHSIEDTRKLHSPLQISGFSTNSDLHSRIKFNTKQNAGLTEASTTEAEEISVLLPTFGDDMLVAADFSIQHEIARTAVEQNPLLEYQLENLILGPGKAISEPDENSGSKVFDAKKAENELDTLLDMFDNSSSLAIVNQGTDPLGKSASYSQAVSVSVISQDIPLELSNEPLHSLKEKSGQVLDSSYFTLLKPAVEGQKLDDVKGLSDLSADFDEWLDSL